MDDQQTTSGEEPSRDADTEPSGPSEASDGYRPPRWAWFALGGLAVVVIAMGAAVADRDLLFEDDFSTSGVLGNWLEDEGASGSMRYEDETYHVGVAQQGELISIAELPGRRSSIEVGIDARMVSGTGGLSVLCIDDAGSVTDQIDSMNEAGDPGEYYDFFIFFAEDAVAILRSDQPDSPIAVSETSLLHEGMNRIEIGCSGASASDPAMLTLSVNGAPLLEHPEPGGSTSFSAIGLTVYGSEGPAEAAFDNIEVSAV